MKVMKKIATLLLAVCLAIPCFSLVSYAADGKIMFTDPSVKVGETLEVTGVVAKSRGNMGKIQVVMTYDTGYLKFRSGDGIVEGTAGELTYTGDATNETGSRKEFKIMFDVLKAGTTKLTVKSAEVKNVSGTVLDYTKGSSTITIAEGEGAAETPDTEPTEPSEPTDATVEVNGTGYTISNEIPDNEIPEGYEASTLEYDMVTYQVIHSDGFGLTLAYLISEDNVGGLFLYQEANATFAPYEEIAVSDKIRIALLSDVSDIELPDTYVKQNVETANGHEFPAWQSKEDPDFIVLYAVNNRGEKSLYQLDNAEGTYQRFTAPEIVQEETENGFIGKLSGLLENHLDSVILGVGLGFIFFVIIIVILSVKLYNRNAELDEIYDEYGLDDEEEDEEEDEEAEDERADEEDDEKEMELLVQEGLKEVFADEEEPSVQEVSETQTVTTNTVEIPIEKVVKKAEESVDTLGAALAKQQEAEKEQKEKQEEYLDGDEDDDILDNFSMDFIDLDD